MSSNTLPLYHDVELLGCGDCRRKISDEEFLTEINPPGGYGRMQVLICDECMRTGRWDHRKKEHWPNWPEKRA